MTQRRALPSNLRTLQRTIAATLMRPLVGVEEMDPESASVAAEHIKPSDRLTAFERLQLYNQQYWWRLQGTLAEDFRGLRAVLGSRKFDRLAEAYLSTFPSSSWTLRDLGQHLTDFLAARPELTHPRSALALDVARVEWARVVAFDGARCPVVDSAQIAKTPPARLRLSLQPCVTLLELAHPVDELMRRLKRAELSVVSNAVICAQPSATSTLSARRSRKPLYLAVHRVDFAVYYKRLEPEAYRLLRAIADGATLEEACADAFAGSADSPGRSAARVREWFTRWMQFGWFCSRSRS